MVLDPPGEIHIDCGALTLLERVLEAAAPQEGCALLLGQRQAAQGDAPPLWRVRRVWPTLNVWEPAAERHQRFCIDPREQLLAQKWARAQGLAVLGSAHSHPRGEPIPSSTDRSLAPLPTLMLIRGTGSGTGSTKAGERAGAGLAAELRCWWLEEPAPPRLLPWRMGD
jgi:proteasome lid subunit RPN8/RPN11